MNYYLEVHGTILPSHEIWQKCEFYQMPLRGKEILKSHKSPDISIVISLASLLLVSLLITNRNYNKTLVDMILSLFCHCFGILVFMLIALL